MKKLCGICDFEDAEYIDDMDNYLCEDCMNKEVEDDDNTKVLNYERYEMLDWENFPKNGFSE